jgi:peptide/nickel transport system permease protein
MTGDALTATFGADRFADSWRSRATSGWHGLSITGRVGLSVFVLYIVGIVCIPVFDHTSPSAINFSNALLHPGAKAWFGTDELGRDLFIRVFIGARTSFLAALAIVIPAALLGTIVGSVAGFWGGAIDSLLMRFTDLVLAFPYLILALVIAAILGPSLRNAVFSLIVVAWPSYSRIARGQVQVIKQEDFVTAARALGASRLRILRREVLPHAWAALQTKLLVDFGYAMIALASLSFIGLGAQPPAPELGALLLQSRDYALNAWWYGVFPGLALLIPVVSLNVLGDAINDMRESGSRKR